MQIIDSYIFNIDEILDFFNLNIINYCEKVFETHYLIHLSTHIKLCLLNNSDNDDEISIDGN